MARYWIGDAAGRVLGPMDLAAARELLANGRMPGAGRVSTDGRMWRPLSSVPELSGLAGATGPAPRDGTALIAELQRLRGRPPREVLGVAGGAGIEDCRTAFFARVKQVHPSRLPFGADHRLRKAYGDMFQLLSDAMSLLEQERTSPAAAPSFAPEQFVGWRKENGEVRVELDVTAQTAYLLTAVPSVSAENDGFYLPSKSTLPMFQKVEVTLRFSSPAREIRSPGRVVYESAGAGLRLPAGVGIRLTSIAEDDRKFLRYFAKKLELAKISR